MKRLLGIIFFSVVLFTGCSDDLGDNGEDKGGGGGFQRPPQMNLNMENAFGLAVVENDRASALALVEEHNKRIDELGLVGAPKIHVAGSEEEGFSLSSEGRAFTFPSLTNDKFALVESNEAAQLMSIDKDGTIEEVLTFEDNPNADEFDQKVDYPSVKTVAVSPTGELYLHFSQPFIFKDVSHDENPWDFENGYQCQIFTSTSSVEDLLENKDGVEDALQCIDNLHFISSWQAARESVFQFDNEGNAYYRAEIPNTPKQLVYKLKRGKTYEDLDRDADAISEKINANICVENFLVTQTAGIFYTGQTCQDNNYSGDSGFFRYISPTNVMTEIARGWWNFIFDIQEATGDDTNENDQAVFFGPNPLSATTASWDSACVFNFDPEGETPQARISEVITCGSNIWDWVEMRRQVDVDNYGRGYTNWLDAGEASPTVAWRKEATRRCEDKSEVFAGGGSQISSIKQDSDGDVYVVGNIRKKKEGTLTCNVVFRGPHCVIDSYPALEVDGNAMDSEADCLAEQGTWEIPGNCNWGSAYDFDACIGTANTWNFTENKCTDTETGKSYPDLNNSVDCLQDLVWEDNTCKHSSSPDNAPENDNGDAIAFEDQDDCENQSARRNWSGETIHYQNVTGDLCVTEETGDKDLMWDWDDASNQFSRMGYGDGFSTPDAFTSRFIVQHFNCNPVQSSSSGDQWTDELKALALVDKTSKKLNPLSTANEQAINVWLVNDDVYYSSYDVDQGKYLLNAMKKEARCINPDFSSKTTCEAASLAWLNDQCVDASLTTSATCEAEDSRDWIDQYSYEVISDFEAYTVSASTDANKIMVSGLDFSDNSYKTGTINPTEENPVIELNKELTGVIRSVLVLD